ncbi:MAG: hypothetical protein ACTHLZ_01705 [Tepidisphaeraceae bacterium]
MSSDRWGAWRPRHASLIWWALGLLLVVIPPFWAGDASFTSDDPLLIRKALDANAAHQWAVAGQMGTVGWQYGPLPIWIYQVGLHATSDPVQLAQLRCVLVSLVTLSALAWIAALIGAGGGWLILVGVSPYLLLYARQLWDNTFNIPLAALAAAAALQVVVRRSLWPLPLLIGILGCMLLIHPMALAMAGGIAVLLAGWGWPAVKGRSTRARLLLAASVLLVLAAGWGVTGPYRSVLASGSVPPPAVSTHPNAWWFALLSPRILSSAWIDYFFPHYYLHHIPAAPLFGAAQLFSSLAVFGLAWAGIALTILRWRTGKRDPMTLAGGLAVFILVAQTALNVATHTYGHPHYYNATWIAPALLIAVSLDSARAMGRYVPTAITVLTTAGVAICTVLIHLEIHRTGGTRFEFQGRPVGYGPTLANEAAVVQAARQFPPESPLYIMVMVFRDSIVTLQQWESLAPTPEPKLTPTRLEIRYDDPANLSDGHIHLSALPTTAVP